MTAAKLEGYIRRLRQIGEHEIAEVMQGMWEGLKAFKCSKCIHMYAYLTDEPCASCARCSNWEWRGD